MIGEDRDLPAEMSSRPRMEPAPGTLFENYRIIQKLGEGPAGAVFEAYDRGRACRVAVKLLSASFARDAGFMERFERDRAVLNRLNHPGIVSVFNIGVSGQVPYFTMELVEGASLASRLCRGGALELREALEILRQVASALHAAHRLGLAHLNLKPSNILMDRKGRVKVGDFGLGGVPGKPRADGLLSEGGLYCSPEQLRAGEADLRSDIYSTGLIFHESLCGQASFASDRPRDVFAEVGRDKAPSVRSVKSDLPEDVDVFLNRSMAGDPNERYQDMIEMLGDIDRLLKGKAIRRAPEGHFKEEPLAQGERTPGRRRKAATAALLGAAVATAAFVFSTVSEFRAVRRDELSAAKMRRDFIERNRTESASSGQADARRSVLVLPKGFIPKEGSSIDQRSGLPLVAVSIRDGHEMLLIEGGKFIMGSSEWPDNRYPAHPVQLDYFYIGRGPVTQGQYLEFMRDTRASAPNAHLKGAVGGARGLSEDVAPAPVEVSWREANDYCRWAGERLASEAQWEKAVRSPQARLFASAPGSPRQDRGTLTEPGMLSGGGYPRAANPYESGDSSLGGHEWCADFYDERYYAASPAVNPEGPGEGSLRVIRDAGKGYTWRGGAIAEGENFIFRPVMIPRVSSGEPPVFQGAPN